MKKIKVCHLASGYFRDNPRIFYRQCLSLKKNDYSVSLLLNDGIKEQIINDIKIKSTNKKFNNRILDILLCTFIFFGPSVKEKADIYQLHSPELIPLGLLLKLLGKSVTYDAHEDMESHILEKKTIPFFLRNFISKVFTLFMNLALRFFDGVITPHNHVLDKLIKINPNSKLVTNFPLSNIDITHSYEDYVKRGDIVCYSGTVYPHSQQSEIIKAVIDHPRAQYHVAGFIPEEMKNKYRKISDLKKFKFHGLMPSNKLIEFYNYCSLGVCIFPYMGNLGGKQGTYAVNKLFEYMEAGLPVVCSDYSLWKDIIDKYKCGLYVDPYSLPQIKNAISFILDNKDEAYLMGLNARKAIEKEFNWNISEKEYLSSFNFLN